METDVRVVVDVDGAVPWREWMTRQGAEQKWIDQLAGAAGEDSVGDWWVFEGTIPWTQWVEIIDMETGDPTWQRPMGDPRHAENVTHLAQLLAQLNEGESIKVGDLDTLVDRWLS
jgi:hypothetical protein